MHKIISPKTAKRYIKLGGLKAVSARTLCFENKQGKEIKFRTEIHFETKRVLEKGNMDR
jgi:hypothetical protein